MQPLSASESEQLSVIRQQIETLSADQRGALESVFVQFRLESALRNTGYLNLILGGYTLFLASSGLNPAWVSSGQIVFGLVTLALSVWSIVRPSVIGWRLFSILFLFSGLWNLNIHFAFGSGIGLLLILGVLQLYWAYVYNRAYRRDVQKLRALPQPTEHTRQQYQTALDLLRRVPAQPDDGLIEITLNGARYLLWLLSDRAVLSAPRYRMLKVMNISDFRLELKNIPDPAKDGRQRFPIRLHLDDGSTRGSISRKGFARFTAWQRAQSGSTST
ncbi:MAG: hypothetical protein SF162_00085 [bacterium]|nr:hypothetical protein [bacterium]